MKCGPSLTGKILSSQSFGNVLVLNETKDGKHIRYSVKFLNTQTILEGVRKDAILTGNIRDPYATTLLGRGFLGLPKRDGLTTKQYYALNQLWNSLFYKCYDINHREYYLYGKRGVYVCQQWFSFERFIEDIQKIPNWNKKLNNWKRYSLNKDTKTDKNGYFCYSLETCNWADAFEQNRNRSNVIPLKAINPNGEIFIFATQTECVNKFPFLKQQSISKCLSGKQKRHKKWRFQRI